MITVVCGEDSVASREHYIGLKHEYGIKNYEIRNLSISDLPEIPQWMGESRSLFGLSQVFFCENISKKASKRSNPKLYGLLEGLANSKDVIVVDWEDSLSKRELKLPSTVQIKEFKPPRSIFQLLDSCYPSNYKIFLAILYSLPERTDEAFVFIMLSRHIRNLLLVCSGSVPPTIQKWQVWKLSSQAKHWDSEKLCRFYEGLHRIDVMQKTGVNPYNLRKSLDILAAYFL